MRDLCTHPYTKDEQRVVAWLVGRSPEIGGGDDPIGFLLASYEYVHAELTHSTMMVDRLLRGEVP